MKETNMIYSCGVTTKQWKHVRWASQWILVIYDHVKGKQGVLLEHVTDVSISVRLGKDPRGSIFKPNLKFNMFLNENCWTWSCILQEFSLSINYVSGAKHTVRNSSDPVAPGFHGANNSLWRHLDGSLCPS